MADSADPSAVGATVPEPIPWDAPSRFGVFGRLARRLLRRLLRPYEVREKARAAEIRRELEKVAGRLETLIAGLDTRMPERLGEYERRLEGLELALREMRTDLQAGIETLDAHADARFVERDRAVGGQLESLASEVALVRALAEPQLDSLGIAAGVRATVVRGSNREAPRAICSLATGRYLEYLAISGSSFAEYARRWGWDLVLSAEDLSAGRPPPWGKVPLIRELLDRNDWLLWIDADAIIVDPYANFMDVIRPDKDLYLVEHRWGAPLQHVPNAGVMLIRSSEWSRSLFERVWSSEELILHPWSENAALMHLIGYELAPARLAHPNRDTAHVELIDLGWNSLPIDPSSLPKVNHYAGIGEDKSGLRERLLRDLAAFRTASGLTTTAPSSRGGAEGVDLGPIRSRDELPQLLNSLGLVGCGVEVGVQEGVFSEHLLRHWRGAQLISVDPWAEGDPHAYRDISNVPQAEHEVNLRAAEARLGRFSERSTLWRMTSRDAAARLPNGCLDFVYLDARHDQQSVTEDLRCWYDKVRPGGLVCGHDYLNGDLPEGTFGVKAAVDEFFARKGLLVRSTSDDEWPSWFAVRRAELSSGAARD